MVIKKSTKAPAPEAHKMQYQTQDIRHILPGKSTRLVEQKKNDFALGFTHDNIDSLCQEKEGFLSNMNQTDLFDQ